MGKAEETSDHKFMNLWDIETGFKVTLALIYDIHS